MRIFDQIQLKYCGSWGRAVLVTFFFFQPPPYKLDLVMLVYMQTWQK